MLELNVPVSVFTIDNPLLKLSYKKPALDFITNKIELFSGLKD